jgi:hypothetical protein
MAMAIAAHAGDTVKFAYQGRVLVDGSVLTGVADVKVALLATSGSTVVTLWSNDGTSVDGSEPTAGEPVAVVNGVFDFMVGDTGQEPLPAILFNRDDELSLRVWFDDGYLGFQQLSPDRRIPKPRILGLREATEDLTLYVNASTGDDHYSAGLSPIFPSLCEAWSEEAKHVGLCEV